MIENSFVQLFFSRIMTKLMKENRYPEDRKW